MSENLVKIKDLNVVYSAQRTSKGKKNEIQDVNNLSLEINKGEILSIAGESGCGKSTLAKALMKLVPVKSGEVFFEEQNISEINKNNFYKNIQMVFQNPYSSLNPKMKIGEILAEPLEINTCLTKAQIKDIVHEKLENVGLDKDCLKLYPHEFSGGQRQRIAIARALVLNPKFIIADEPVSALDVSIQAQIINLILELKKEFNLTFLFISHDISVIRYISDRIAIMYLGEIVEQGLAQEIFDSPKHPYTQILLNSAPTLNQQQTQKPIIKGELPSADNLPDGCKFHTRCPYAKEICKKLPPEVVNISSTHSVKCVLCSQVEV